MLTSMGHGTINYDKQYAQTRYVKSSHREYLQRAWLMTGIAIIDLPEFLWRKSLGEVVLGTVIAEREHRRHSSLPQPFSCCPSLKSDFKKCNEQTFVFDVIWKNCQGSRGIAWIHFFLSTLLSAGGKLWKEIPFSFLLSAKHSGTHQWSLPGIMS